MLVTVPAWLTKVEQNPVPLRTMRVVKIERETQKAIYVHLKGTPAPSSHCMVCGREITHPVSLLYGVGPICGGHHHVDTTGKSEENYRKLQEALGAVTWDGWLPKSRITMTPEKCWRIIYTYQGREYRTRTFRESVKDKILSHADEIISIEETEE